VCFSSGDLRKLAEELGVDGSISWSRGTNEAARDLVRCFERKHDLEALVARLREERPLVEWPEPPDTQAPDAPDATGKDGKDATSAGIEGAGGALAGPGFLDWPKPEGSSGEEAVAPAPLMAMATPPAAPIAQAVVGAGATQPAASDWAPPPSVAAAPAPLSSSPLSTAAPSSTAWPGTIPDAAARPAPSRGLDPKLLIIVPALTLLAAIIAFIAGRAGSTPEVATVPGASSAASPDGAPPRPYGLAVSVDDAIARSLANVARACELPLRGPPEEDILLRVFDQCGPPPALPPQIPDSTGVGSNPTVPGPGPAQPAAGGERPARPAPAGKPAALPVDTSPGAVCTRACETEHRTCKSQCGKEPTQSTLYAEYQSCLGRCLTGASKCRLTCQ
jgi:hypothetical protein